MTVTFCNNQTTLSFSVSLILNMLAKTHKFFYWKHFSLCFVSWFFFLIILIISFFANIIYHSSNVWFLLRVQMYFIVSNHKAYHSEHFKRSTATIKSWNIPLFHYLLLAIHLEMRNCFGFLSFHWLQFLHFSLGWPKPLQMCIYSILLITFNSINRFHFYYILLFVKHHKNVTFSCELCISMILKRS